MLGQDIGHQPRPHKMKRKTTKMILVESSIALLRLVSSRNGTRSRSEVTDGFYDEYLFNRMFDLEIKRIKRSKKPFFLILINIAGLKKSIIIDLINRLKKVFVSNYRDTDIRGWYKQDDIIGIIFTDLDSVGHDTREALFGKTLSALSSQMDPNELRNIYITFHSYPKDLEYSTGSGRFDLKIGHDLSRKNTANKSPSRVRRLINYVSSFLALSN